VCVCAWGGGGGSSVFVCVFMRKAGLVGGGGFGGHYTINWGFHL